ncbi:MAG: MJ0042-type zinc finger domain-containing protein [Brevundimonas sp.]
MILTCPECATSYSVPDEALGAKGRRVRCQSCAHQWMATPDEPLVLSVEPAPAPVPDPDHAPIPESLAATPAPELPKAYRARAELQRRIRRAATHGAMWAGLTSVFVAIMGAAWLFRVNVVEVFPRAAAAYAAVGAPVNLVGLDFEALSARRSLRDPSKVLVSGALRNVRDREVTVPPVRVALLDSHGAEIGQAVVRIDAAPVLPGGVQGFAVMIADPAAKAADVGVDFVRGDLPAPAATSHDSSRHVPDHAAPPATAHGAADAHHDAPDAAHGPSPGADHGAAHGTSAPAAANHGAHAQELPAHGLRPAVSLRPAAARPHG